MLLSDKNPLENVTKTSYLLELITSWDRFATHNWLQSGGVLVEHLQVFKKFRVHTTREIFKNLFGWGKNSSTTHTSGSFSLIGYRSPALHHWGTVMGELIWSMPFCLYECHVNVSAIVCDYVLDEHYQILIKLLKCIECPPAQTMRMSSIWYLHQPRESQYACPARKPGRPHSGSCPQFRRLISPICPDSTQLHVCT